VNYCTRIQIIFIWNIQFPPSIKWWKRVHKIFWLTLQLYKIGHLCLFWNILGKNQISPIILKYVWFWFASLLAHMLKHIRDDDLVTPLMLIMQEREKMRNTGNIRFRSMYRDLLFLTLVAYSRDSIVDLGKILWVLWCVLFVSEKICSTIKKRYNIYICIQMDFSLKINDKLPRWTETCITPWNILSNFICLF
jgi:hypothetical protein